MNIQSNEHTAQSGKNAPTEPQAVPQLEVRDLRLGFTQASALLTAVNGVSFQVDAGETLALLGESGCGKSVTALSLMRLLPEAGRILGGQVLLAGQNLFQRSEAEMRLVRGASLAMIFQEPATSLNPVLTVGRQIGEVLAEHLQLFGAAQAQRAAQLLDAVGIADAQRRLSEYPFQLSGGMKQRVMIAIALAANPQFLIADEPSTALDVTIQAQILELLRGLQKDRQMGILLITHDLGVVAQMAHRVAVMYAGEIVEEAPREQFFRAPQHPYTQKLFAALPDLTRRGKPLETIAGQVPSLAQMPIGCRFAARCPHVFAACLLTSPAAHVVGDALAGHFVRCHLFAATAPTFSTISTTGPISVPSVLKPSLPTNPLEQTAEAPKTKPQALLTLDNFCVHFPIRRGILQRTTGFVKAVDGVSLSLSAGRTLALVGESGCGKTTVGKAILQLINANNARISGSARLTVRANTYELGELSASALRPLRRSMQMIFQDPFASLNPRLSIGEIINEGINTLRPNNALSSNTKASKADAQQALIALLQQVGLDASAVHRYPHEFSGGQRQRIAIARALAVQPELIICDEPSSALDVSVQAQILNLLKNLQDNLGLSYLFITHNFAVVDYLAHEVAVMYLGRIVERGLVDEVLRTPQHPYTQALIAAVPTIAHALKPTTASPSSPTQHAGKHSARNAPHLTGEMPSPANPPSGCHFHPRCPKASPICHQQSPQNTAISVTHQVCCHHLSP